jgi:hypothetical protein
MHHKKVAVVRARVSDKIKKAIADIADQRDENEAVIVREGLTFYLSAVMMRPSRRSQIHSLLERSRQESDQIR